MENYGKETLINPSTGMLACFTTNFAPKTHITFFSIRVGTFFLGGWGGGGAGGFWYFFPKKGWPPPVFL